MAKKRAKVAEKQGKVTLFEVFLSDKNPHFLPVQMLKNVAVVCSSATAKIGKTTHINKMRKPFGLQTEGLRKM